MCCPASGAALADCESWWYVSVHSRAVLHQTLQIWLWHELNMSGSGSGLATQGGRPGDSPSRGLERPFTCSDFHPAGDIHRRRGPTPSPREESSSYRIRWRIGAGIVLLAAGYNSELIAVSGANHNNPADPTSEAGREALAQLAMLAEPLGF